ncbi:MAG: DUF2207 domain-containing protein, partial [Erysipelotrichaceae bacterium]|nr:DUF2207 domain-containing protein [Erysipelotrichaceae bacterium]
GEKARVTLVNNYRVSTLLIPLFMVLFFSVPFFAGLLVYKNSSKIAGYAILLPAIVNGLALMAIIFHGGVLRLVVADKITLVLTVISAVLAIGVIIMAVNMDKRTSENNRLLGRIRGFRNFIETAEKDRITALVNENPEYFYDILPYAYVLNVSRQWTEHFEDIVTSQPAWLEAADSFDYFTISRMMDSTVRTLSHEIVSKPIVVRSSSSWSSGSSSDSSYDSGYSSSDYSSSSSSSGGGSSGGGSGGGGGDSW